MSFAPDLSHSTFMKGLAHEVVEAMRLNGLAGAQISGTLKHLGTGLARRFGGGPVYVPRGRPCANEMADKAFKLQQQGASAPAIAKRFGVTVRWAQCLVKRGKERAAGRAPRNELE